MADQEQFFPPEILQQVTPEAVAVSEARGYLSDQLGPDLADKIEQTGSITDLLGFGIPDDTARLIAAQQRPECLSVRIPGLPGGEYVARAADWWARQAVNWFGAPVEALGEANDSINGTIQRTLGIPGGPGDPTDSKPRPVPRDGPPDDGFLVKVPNWEDIIQLNNNSVFDERSKQQRALDFAEQLRRSPTPPGLNDVGKLLTQLDNVQDEAATLSIMLMLAEKMAGRAIPGVGWVATAADALQVIYGLASTATGSSMPGRKSKRKAKDKAQSTRNGYGGRLDEMRRSGRLGLGWGDVLQGLQATDSWFGAGIQIGGVMGFLQDSMWGVVRGAEFQAAGPIWDPLGFTEAGRKACYRSPTLDQIHPRAYFMAANSSLRLWSSASRVMPYIDTFGEPALASALIGMRHAETVLGPWLRSGVWIDPLKRAVEIRERVPGGVEEHGTRGLLADEWVQRTMPGTMAAVTRAIGNVQDKGRQAFYESLVSSIGWGLVGDLEPASRFRELKILGPIKDAFTLLDANKIPVFDLED